MQGQHTHLPKGVHVWGRQVVNPATGELIAKVPEMKGNETKAAIAAASAAWPAWCKKTAKERGAIMRKCAPRAPRSLRPSSLDPPCRCMHPRPSRAPNTAGPLASSVAADLGHLELWPFSGEQQLVRVSTRHSGMVGS